MPNLPILRIDSNDQIASRWVEYRLHRSCSKNLRTRLLPAHPSLYKPISKRLLSQSWKYQPNTCANSNRETVPMASRNGYGTIAQDYPVADPVDVERAAMLQTSSSENAFASRCVRHMTVNVTKSWGDIALLGCYIITGLLDSSSVMAWGSFVSMQTG